MKHVLITGANRGIGLELVRQSAARGDLVFAGCRIPRKAFALEKFSAQYPGKVSILPIDIANEESIAQSAASVAKKVDRLDSIFNNAAINMGDETLSEVNADVLLKTIRVNAVGAVLMSQKFLFLLKEGDAPKIINISSEAGSIEKMTKFRGYNYCGSKAALNMYTRSLAWDPETEGITVISIHPGWVRTDMGGSEAHLSVTQSVEGMLKVVDGLTPDDNGKFYTWKGIEYPW